MKQIIAHKKIGPVQGILLVLALVIILVLANYLVIGYLAAYLGNAAANIAFWIIGVLLAWQVLRLDIATFAYEMDDDVLRLSRRYGRKERIIEDIYLSRLLFVGSPEEAKKRYPQAKKLNAVHPGTKDAVTAVVYQNSIGTQIALTQLNDEFKAKLVEVVRKG